MAAPQHAATKVHLPDREDLRNRVDEALIATLSRQRAVLADVDSASNDLLSSIAGLLDGGKRLRPMFCYWGWRGTGREGNKAAIRAAAALELFQAAALIHDDIIDRSDTRRGHPTVHRIFADRHQRGSSGAAWRGDSGSFGAAAAILAGDLCLAWSSELLGLAVGEGPGVKREHGIAARKVYSTMSTQLMAGQYLDVLEQAEALGSVERALHVIRFKSAKYTIEHPLLLGGELAGAERSTLQTYSTYAIPLGEAFQLRDDMLGVFGDSTATGKPTGDDLREGKRTVLVALATRDATAAQRQVLEDAVGNSAADENQLNDVRAILLDTGAASQVEKMITRRVADAELALAGGVIDPTAAEVLRELIAATTQRSA
ncbi:MAG: polyprenyl synthetase [Micrococcales bacterium]|nr:MAG: polyprenyl synthetase [Micrococcales bacterium]PIE26628.1 MAG: polyprenyl synthetase [Micrococcales bacterium]